MNFNNSNVERKPIAPLARLAACFIIVACLAGCGKSLSGTYVGEAINGSTVSIEFKGGNKAFNSVMGQTRELKYAIEGDKVIFDTGTGKEVYTIQKDGDLTSGTGFMSITLKKK